MYRSYRKSEIMFAERFPTFVEGGSTKMPYQNGNIEHYSSFFNRIFELPLIRNATSCIQNKYQSTKKQSQLLRNVLERGENTVNYSWGRAAQVLQTTGIGQVLEKPLSFVDSKAVQMLDTVEKKLPFIGQTQDEIKLAFRDKIDGTFEKIITVRENIKSVGTLAFESVKQKSEIKVQAFLDTSVGQTVNQTVEGALKSADHFVDKVLPEGHSHTNGKVGISNGSATTLNGYKKGNLDHAKCLTQKLTRRVSTRIASKSHEIVETVKFNSLLDSSKNLFTVAGEKAKHTQQMVSKSFISTFTELVNLFASGVDSSLLMLSKVLPASALDKLTSVLDQLVGKLPKRQCIGVLSALHEN